MTQSPGNDRHGPTPQAAADFVRQATDALGQGQTAAGLGLLDKALALAPDDPEIHRLHGIASLMAGARDQAIEDLERALELRPDDAVIHMTLGSVLVDAGQSEAGIACLKRACELAPGHAEAWYNYGVALEFVEDMAAARHAFEQVIALVPGHLKARIKLAYAMVSLGDAPGAVGMLRETLRLQPDCIDAWVALGNLKTERFSAQDVHQLKGLLERPGLAGDARISLGFMLAKGLEDQSEYGAAYDVVSRANATMRRNLHWSRDEERTRVAAIAQAFSGDLASAGDPELGKEVIFVVHLPRSGSTLTEQILAAHPDVEAGDELQVLPHLLDEESGRRGKPFPHWVPEATPEVWRRLGQAYLDRTRSLRERHPRFTDKSPDNWALVGAALAMLPAARVVNVRRDPLETCLSCYFQLFHFGCHFTYDLGDMAHYYAGYDRLSAMWRESYPDRYLESRYESLLEDTEAQIRRLLAFCGLSFDPACLDFHKVDRTVHTLSSAQVRQPLRKNTARSARYGSRLDALREHLRAVGVPVDAA